DVGSLDSRNGRWTRHDLATPAAASQVPRSWNRLRRWCFSGGWTYPDRLRTRYSIPARGTRTRPAQRGARKGQRSEARRLYVGGRKECWNQRTNLVVRFRREPRAETDRPVAEGAVRQNAPISLR